MKLLYTVRWQTCVVADSPEGAAREAREAQLDRGSKDNFFEVCLLGQEDNLQWESVDLEEKQ